MTDATPVAMRLTDKLHGAIHDYVNTQDLQVAREVFAQAIDDAGVREAVEKLEFIKDGRGAYSRDHHQHAENCITDMKAAAVEALSALTVTQEVSDE